MLAISSCTPDISSVVATDKSQHLLPTRARLSIEPHSPAVVLRPPPLTNLREYHRDCSAPPYILSPSREHLTPVGLGVPAFAFRARSRSTRGRLIAAASADEVRAPRAPLKTKKSPSVFAPNRAGDYHHDGGSPEVGVSVYACKFSQLALAVLDCAAFHTTFEAHSRIHHPLSSRPSWLMKVLLCSTLGKLAAHANIANRQRAAETNHQSQHRNRRLASGRHATTIGVLDRPGTNSLLCRSVAASRNNMSSGLGDSRRSRCPMAPPSLVFSNPRGIRF